MVTLLEGRHNQFFLQKNYFSSLMCYSRPSSVTRACIDRNSVSSVNLESLIYVFCYTMIFLCFFKWGCSRLGGCRVLKSLIAVFMGKKSCYGETLNWNTHPKTCTNLTLFLNKNAFIIFFFTIHCMKVSRNCFAPDKWYFGQKKYRNYLKTISVMESRCNVGQT